MVNINRSIDIYFENGIYSPNKIPIGINSLLYYLYDIYMYILFFQDFQQTDYFLNDYAMLLSSEPSSSSTDLYKTSLQYCLL